MKTQAKHTATPWKVEIRQGDPGIPRSQGGGEKIYLYAEEKKIAVISRADVGLPESKYNASFIVKAVNSHEALVEACKEAKIAFDHRKMLSRDWLAVELIEKALKQAEEV